MIHWCRKICFLICFCFWFVLFLCKLLQIHHCELVLVMEHDFGCSMKTLHELCESRIYKGIGKKNFGEQRDEDWRNIYDAS